MRLSIKYTIETEINRVRYTFGKLKFYEEQGYKVFMPEGISIDDTPEKLRQAVLSEFDADDLHAVKGIILNDFNKNTAEINRYTHNLNKDFPNDVELVLTRYGVGGSYNLPNRIIVNINYKINQLFNLVHELTHLAIEDNMVKKHALLHSEKEVLVNWLMERDAGIRGLFDEGYIPAKNKYELDALSVAKKCGLI